jgi:hypothetical protein
MIGIRSKTNLPVVATLDDMDGMSLGAMRCNRAMDHGLASFLSEFNA